MPATIDDIIIPFTGIATWGGVDLNALGSTIKMRLRLKQVAFGKTQSDHGLSKLVQCAQDVEVEIDSENAMSDNLQRALGLAGVEADDVLTVTGNAKQSPTPATLWLYMGMDGLRGGVYPTRFEVKLNKMVPTAETVELLLSHAKPIKSVLKFVSAKSWSLYAEERIVVPLTALLRGDEGEDLTYDEMGREYDNNLGDNLVILDLATKKYGPGSYKFNSTGSTETCFLQTALASGDFSVGTLPFTVGGWVWIHDPRDVNRLVTCGVDTNYNWSVEHDGANDNLRFYCVRSTGHSSQIMADYSYTWAPGASEVHHWMIVRSGEDLLLFIDFELVEWTGVSTAIDNETNLDPNDSVFDYLMTWGSNINGGPGGFYSYFDGNMDDMFFSAGTAIYTEEPADPPVYGWTDVIEVGN